MNELKVRPVAPVHRRSSMAAQARHENEEVFDG